MKIDHELTVKDFLDKIQDMNQEIGCDGERIGSHKIKSHIYFSDQNHDYYRLVEIENDQLPGCGCWDGIIFRLEKEED